MKSFVLNMKPEHLADGKLTDEGKRSAREQLLGKFKASMTDSDGQSRVDQALIDKVDQAIEDALGAAADRGTIAQLSLSTMAEACKRAQDMIEAVPEGLQLTARAIASDGASAKTVFELGEAAAQATIAIATMHVLRSNLEHLIECECAGLAKNEAGSTTATPTTPEAVAQA